MNNLSKVISGLLLASLTITSLPAYSDDTKVYKLEKALMKYVLSYEALQKAKQDDKQRKKLPKYIKNYRESYAQYLELLRESRLYDPTSKDIDPAGDFNNDSSIYGKSKRKWKTVDTSTHRSNIKSAIKSGKEPEDVIADVEANLPQESYSEPDEPNWIEIIKDNLNNNSNGTNPESNEDPNNGVGTPGNNSSGGDGVIIPNPTNPLKQTK